MKKLICTFLATLTFLSCSICHGAKIGSVIGTVYNTDIVAYINNYAIPSYAANGTSVVVAEDLRNFGFDVIWDQSSRTLSIYRNSSVYPSEMNFSKTGTPGTKFADLLYTDIKVYANGTLIPSYAINGYTMIPLESLTMFGSYNWVNEQRALKLWIDGLHMRSTMQPILQATTNYVGRWASTSHPDNYNFYIYKQNGNKIDILIEAILGNGQRLGHALVENVAINNGVGNFYFTDSFYFEGYGTVYISGDTLTVSYSVTEEGWGWSITAGEDHVYKKISNSIGFTFDPNDYRF